MACHAVYVSFPWSGAVFGESSRVRQGQRAVSASAIPADSVFAKATSLYTHKPISKRQLCLAFDPPFV